jgi:threonine dehydratase
MVRDEVSLTAEAILRAAASIPQVFANSPHFESVGLSDKHRSPVMVKVETVNPLGCFKGRGTWLAMKRLHDEGIVSRRRGVVVVSSGNFGQGVAYAGSHMRIPVTVFMPKGANRNKVERIERLGAATVESGSDSEECAAIATAHADAQGSYRLVDGVDAPLVAIGAGTIAVELTDAIKRGHLRRPDAVLVPVGAGALICGIGTWLRHALPDTKVIGIQSTAAPALTLSWRQGKLVTTRSANTRAEGIAVRVPTQASLTVMQSVVDDMILVSERAIAQATRELSRDLGLTVELAAATPWAACRKLKQTGAVLLVITGSNVRSN